MYSYKFSMLLYTSPNWGSHQAICYASYRKLILSNDFLRYLFTFCVAGLTLCTARTLRAAPTIASSCHLSQFDKTHIKPMNNKCLFVHKARL